MYHHAGAVVVAGAGRGRLRRWRSGEKRASATVVVVWSHAAGLCPRRPGRRPGPPRRLRQRRSGLGRGRGAERQRRGSAALPALACGVMSLVAPTSSACRGTPGRGRPGQRRAAQRAGCPFRGLVAALSLGGAAHGDAVPPGAGVAPGIGHTADPTWSRGPWHGVRGLAGISFGVFLVLLAETAPASGPGRWSERAARRWRCWSASPSSGGSRSSCPRQRPGPRCWLGCWT